VGRLSSGLFLMPSMKLLITSADLEPPGPVIGYANPPAARITGYSPMELLGPA
jgi:PAS domain-containing protein